MNKLFLVPLIAILTYSSIFAAGSLSSTQTARIRAIDTQIAVLLSQITTLKTERATLVNGEATISSSDADRAWMAEYGVTEESYIYVARLVGKDNVKAYFIKNGTKKIKNTASGGCNDQLSESDLKKQRKDNRDRAIAESRITFVVGCGIFNTATDHYMRSLKS
jgi:hypothetical protein